MISQKVPFERRSECNKRDKDRDSKRDRSRESNLEYPLPVHPLSLFSSFFKARMRSEAFADGECHGDVRIILFTALRSWARRSPWQAPGLGTQWTKEWIDKQLDFTGGSHIC
jgi:hypothetical protein